MRAVKAHQLKELRVADKYYTKILETDPLNPDANHNKGMLEVDAERVSCAIPFLEQAITSKPTAEYFWITYIDVMLQLGRLSEAQKFHSKQMTRMDQSIQFEKIVTVTVENDKRLVVNPKNWNPPGSELHSISDLVEAKNYSEVIIESHDLLKYFPGSAILFNLIGASHYLLSENEKAIVALKRAIEIKPDYFEAYSNLGNAYLKINKPEKAVSTYELALTIKPNDADILNNLGNALNAMKVS